MKYKIFSLFIISLFLYFSCGGTPSVKEDHIIEVSDNLFNEQGFDEQEEQIDEFIIKINETEMAEHTHDFDDPKNESIIDEQFLSELEQQLIDLDNLLSDMEQRLLDMEQRLIDSAERNEREAENEPEPVQAAVVETPPVVIPQPPPVQPPVQVQPPPSQPAIQAPAQTQTPQVPIQTPPVQTTTPPQSDEAVDETQVTRNNRGEPLFDLPPSPAARIEPLVSHDSDVIYSRVVRATVGQTLEIPFRGSGWVYLGELTSKRGIVYNSRRNDVDGQSFIFTLEEAGTYALKFYRQDFIRDFILNDHVQVIVGEAPAAAAGWFNPPVDRGRVVAQPRWPSPAEEALLQSGSRLNTEPVVSGIQDEPPLPQNNIPSQGTAESQPFVSQPPAFGTTVITPQDQSDSTVSSVTRNQDSTTTAQIENAVPSRLEPEQYLQSARSTFDTGNVASAIALLNQFMEQYPSGSDEAFWLLGQFYEANSPSRNILLSLDFYRRLVNEYPQSTRVNDARRRISYLERFYINIR
ncbi:MAG: hypothetical protein FWD24_03660 [Treponema sp.]|nr:hypothetical protein [Treponema sp.]